MSKKRNSQTITETFTFVNYAAVNVANLLVSILPLVPTVAGLGSQSGQLANYLAMYRLARIEHVVVEGMMGGPVSSGVTSFYNWFLANVPPGASTPSNLLALETKNMSPLASGDVSNAANHTALRMTRKDLPVTAEAGGPGPCWLATDGDGPGTSWGTIYLVNGSPAGSGNLDFNYKVTLTMSFYELVDPTILSARLKALPAVSEATPQKLRVPRAIRADPEEDLTMSQLKAQLKVLSSK